MEDVKEDAEKQWPMKKIEENITTGLTYWKNSGHCAQYSRL